MVNFDLALKYLIGNEGTTYSDDPNDSGGPTKYGVTLADWAAYTGESASAGDIQNLTYSEVGPFYVKKYWEPSACDRMESAAIAAAVLDTSVLYGIKTCGILCQEALNSLYVANLKLDGIIGDKTIELINKAEDTPFLEKLRGLILDRIDRIISANPKDSVFRKGWTNRANRLLTLSNMKDLISEVAAQKGET